MFILSNEYKKALEKAKHYKFMNITSSPIGKKKFE